MPIHAKHPQTGEAITVHWSDNALVISPRFGISYSFDHAGRLLSLFRDDRSVQRTLDHRLLVREPAGTERRHELEAGESARLLASVFDDLRALVALLPLLALAADDRQQVDAALRLVLAFGPDRLAADGDAFRQLYKPVSILPPDQYLALVLQATEGCSWNRCTFCGLYRDRPFRVHSLETFRAHCLAVREFFGAGLSLRRGIFLADANALVLPQPRLVSLLSLAQEFFALPEGPRPVFSFVSAFDVLRKTPDDWAALHALGLRRAYIGLETGSDVLLRFLNKPGEVSDAIDAVRGLRAGGVAVGVILMAGIGGDRYAAEHVTRSIDTLAAMDLGPDDQVYISTYVSAPDTEYQYQATVVGIHALTDEEIRAQRQALQDGARTAAPAAKVAPYHVEGFAL
jgi:radical SAM superfamily enzyme YgiQ (UPF0313 family)